MKRATCKAGVERLIDYLEGTLSAQMRTVLEAHVAGCSRCRAYLASYVETPRIVRLATDRAPTAEQRRSLLEFLHSHRRIP